MQRIVTQWPQIRSDNSVKVVEMKIIIFIIVIIHEA
jgi:hypothetical protein